MFRAFSNSAYAAAAATAALIATPSARPAPPAAGSVQFVFTSDAHYGLARATFRGRKNVNARDVNRALVASINALVTAAFPADDGIGSGAPVGAIDFIAEGGDVCNREEIVGGTPIEAAARCWREFSTDYLDGLKLTDRAGRKAPLFVVPGNHDASDAVGFYKPMRPATDVSAMVGIFNLMTRPAEPRTNTTFEYDRDRVHASRDAGGVHFAFLHVWPDSGGRAWLARDLVRVPVDVPVVIFSHVGPDPDPRHFRNPNGRHDVNDADKFENLLCDELADGKTAAAGTAIERTALEQFVGAHPNIGAYFHGHSNSNQFYDWTGPHGAVALHVFRVDSPMKGAVSKDDETKLSFQVATIDGASRTMTVREVLWNEHPVRPALAWGESTTVFIGRREKQ